MKKRNLLNNFFKSLNWYPVTILGRLTLTVYFCLLIYVITKIYTEFYTINIVFFKSSITMVGVILVILLWAKLKNERPFEKKTKR